MVSFFSPEGSDWSSIYLGIGLILSPALTWMPSREMHRIYRVGSIKWLNGQMNELIYECINERMEWTLVSLCSPSGRRGAWRRKPQTLSSHTPENQGCLRCAVAQVKGIQVESLLPKWHIIQEADLSNTSWDIARSCFFSLRGSVDWDLRITES